MKLNTIQDHPAQLTGIHYLTGKPVTIDINNGLIERISELKNISASNIVQYISPGLIDNQINGYAGIDFSHSSFKPAGMQIAAKAIWKDGVTSYLPTLITSSHENLLRNFKILASVIGDPYLMGCIPGFHLEGPYISREEGFYGCHPLEHLRKPSWEEFICYQSSAGGKIMQVTISPELEGAMDFIKQCTNNGVAISIGHTNATTEIIKTAVANGARVCTHLGNGCSTFINRHKNPIWQQLADDLLTPSIIADGLHLLPEEVQVIYKVKGPDNLILTSDVNHLIGLAPGRYVYMGSEVIYTEDGVVKNAEKNCLAGASFPVRKGLETMLNYTKCSLGDAIKMASSNVARIYGLTDRGTLEKGKRADIILFERVENKVIINKTFVNGKLVFSNEK